MDLFKQLHVDGKYLHLVMEGWMAYLGFPWGFKNHSSYAEVYSMKVVCV